MGSMFSTNEEVCPEKCTSKTLYYEIIEAHTEAEDFDAFMKSYVGKYTPEIKYYDIFTTHLKAEDGHDMFAQIGFGVGGYTNSIDIKFNTHDTIFIRGDMKMGEDKIPINIVEYDPENGYGDVPRDDTYYFKLYEQLLQTLRDMPDKKPAQQWFLDYIKI